MLTQRLQSCGLKFSRMSGELSYDKNITEIQKFNDGEVNVIVGTDGMARGALHCSSKYVLLFDVPILKTSFEEKPALNEYLLMATRTNSVVITLVRSGRNDLNVMQNMAKYYKFELCEI